MNRIKTGICSYGMSGKLFHAPFINHVGGFELYAVCERSKKEIQQKYPGVISYDSIDELFDDKNIGLMIINTPNYTHFDYARKALLAGKHIVVEKPFCNNTLECDELIRIAEENKKIISVYQNRRWDSDFKTVRKVVEEKLLGTIVEAEFHFDRYDESLSYKLHKETPGPGAGIFYDLGPHLIDQALQLFGMPDAVFADITAFREISKVDDYMEIILIYDRLRVRLKSGYLVKEPVPSFVIHGTKGSFHKSRADVQENMLKLDIPPSTPDWGIEPMSEEGLLHTTINGETVRKKVPTEKGDYTEYYRLLYEALRNGAPVPVTAEDARKVIHIIDKCFESANRKMVVKI
jgi:scyllo-inositol 2-dehydrogenase (NADP+)